MRDSAKVVQEAHADSHGRASTRECGHLSRDDPQAHRCLRERRHALPAGFRGGGNDWMTNASRQTVRAAPAGSFTTFATEGKGSRWSRFEVRRCRCGNSSGNCPRSRTRCGKRGDGRGATAQAPSWSPTWPTWSIASRSSCTSCVDAGLEPNLGAGDRAAPSGPADQTNVTGSLSMRNCPSGMPWRCRLRQELRSVAVLLTFVVGAAVLPACASPDIGPAAPQQVPTTAGPGTRATTGCAPGHEASGFALSFDLNGHGASTPRLAALHFIRQGGTPGYGTSSRQWTGHRDDEGVMLQSGRVWLHATQLNDHTWTIDSGHRCPKS